MGLIKELKQYVGFKVNVRPCISLLGSTSMSERFQTFDKDPEVAIRQTLRLLADRDARPACLETGDQH